LPLHLFSIAEVDHRRVAHYIVGGAEVGGGYAVDLGEVEVVEALERVQGIALRFVLALDGL
jgi:hypothetical protein